MGMHPFNFWNRSRASFAIALALFLFSRTQQAYAVPSEKSRASCHVRVLKENLDQEKTKPTQLLAVSPGLVPELTKPQKDVMRRVARSAFYSQDTENIQHGFVSIEQPNLAEAIFREFAAQYHSGGGVRKIIRFQPNSPGELIQQMNELRTNLIAGKFKNTVIYVEAPYNTSNESDWRTAWLASYSKWNIGLDRIDGSPFVVFVPPTTITPELSAVAPDYWSRRSFTYSITASQ